MNTDIDIAVVGAGAAGIAAVRALRGSSYSVLLLEASQRVGGRAWTVDCGRGLDLDLGCGWLHSAERNPWAAIAADAGVPVDKRDPAWGAQYQDRGFSAEEQKQARQALKSWGSAMRGVASAHDSALEAAVGISPAAWLAYVEQVAGRISGKPLSGISASDYTAYRDAETPGDWRLQQGLGRLITASLPDDALLRLATPVTEVKLEKGGVALQTARGTVRSRVVILTVSTNVLSSGDMILPEALTSWRSAAVDLSMGANEKLFLEVLEDGLFEVETRVIGNPRATRTGAYYLRPLGMGVVEGFFGAEAAEWIASQGPAGAFALAIEELANLFGADIYRKVRPLVVSNWSRAPWIQGGYSCAVPGRAEARDLIARPFDGRIFFAGEATHASDFSTVHGAFASGVRAANEARAALGGATT